jgi:hypothetical protein
MIPPMPMVGAGVFSCIAPKGYKEILVTGRDSEILFRCTARSDVFEEMDVEDLAWAILNSRPAKYTGPDTEPDTPHPQKVRSK